MKKYFYLFATTCKILALCFGTALCATAAMDQVIYSDWKLEDPNKNKPPVSYERIRTLDERIRRLEAEKRAEELEIQQKKEVFEAKRAALVECLNANKVILFSSEDPDCEQCKEQRSIFGEDFTSLAEYVNCDNEDFVCTFRQITAYPTWYLGLKTPLKAKGIKTLEQLAEITGCSF